MRLSEILSKPISNEYRQVEGFLKNLRLNCGKQRKIAIGIVGLNYHCTNCGDIRTFCSEQDLYCIGVNNRLVSIDCTLKCPQCGASIPVWFLIESEEDIWSAAPNVRILKKTEKFSSQVQPAPSVYGQFAELLDKANRAYKDELGAGAIVYLRKIFEIVTVEAANSVGITYAQYEGGNPKNFSALLEKVDEECKIIPAEFSANGRKLFKELSSVVHGDFDESKGLEKFQPFYRLVTGILDNVRSKEEFRAVIETLGWTNEGGDMV